MTHSILVTGANRGIGLELARHYQTAGWKVTGVCRESSAELENTATRVVDGIDVTSEESIRKLLEGVTVPR